MKSWKLEIFRDKQKKCRIRLRSGNGRIIMSSEAYSSHSKAVETVNAFTHVCEMIVQDLTEK